MKDRRHIPQRRGRLQSPLTDVHDLPISLTRAVLLHSSQLFEDEDGQTSLGLHNVTTVNNRDVMLLILSFKDTINKTVILNIFRHFPTFSLWRCRMVTELLKHLNLSLLVCRTLEVGSFTDMNRSVAQAGNEQHKLNWDMHTFKQETGSSPKLCPHFSERASLIKKKKIGSESGNTGSLVQSDFR